MPLGTPGKLGGFPQESLASNMAPSGTPNGFQKHPKTSRGQLGSALIVGTFFYPFCSIPILHSHHFPRVPAPSRYFKNGAALLELALVQWAAHEAVKRGFQPFIPPDLVRARDLGTGPGGPQSGWKMDDMDVFNVFYVLDSRLPGTR